MSTSSSRRLISVASAADQIDVHPKTIRRYIADGRLTGYRIGPRTLRIDAAELEAFAKPIPTAADAGTTVR